MAAPGMSEIRPLVFKANVAVAAGKLGTTNSIPRLNSAFPSRLVLLQFEEIGVSRTSAGL